MTNKKILLGLTTTKGSNWISKIEEINKFNIWEIALFLTGINKEDRKKLYLLLEKTCLKKIPHVHLRSDMKAPEINYLVDRYETELFNIHPALENKFIFDFKEFEGVKDKIYVENVVVIPTQEELDKFGGLCIDFSHWEERRSTVNYYKFKELVKNNKIGCCHVSGVHNYFGFFTKGRHLAKSKNYFNYLEKYKDYLPDIISLELENSFKEQLEYKKYIEENILNLEK